MLLAMENELGRVIQRQLGERSQTWLAEQAKTTQSTISRIIRGVHTPVPETLERIAKALELDAMYLMRLSGVPVVSSSQKDPAVEYLAQKLNDLPPEIRTIAVDALGAQLDAFYEMVKRQEGAALVAEAKAHRPDLAERAEAIKRERQTTTDKIESE